MSEVIGPRSGRPTNAGYRAELEELLAAMDREQEHMAAMRQQADQVRAETADLKAQTRDILRSMGLAI